MPFSIFRDEIARQSADVVVVPANPELIIDGGAGLAVGRVAGLTELQDVCDKLGGCPIGEAVATPAFAFPARSIVHAVGPRWDGTEESLRKLRQAYESALRLSANLGAKSVVLPLISAGAQGCPAEYSLHVALGCVKAFLELHDEVEISLILFSGQATHAGEIRFPGLAQYIDDAYVSEHEHRYQAPLMQVPMGSEEAAGAGSARRQGRGSCLGRLPFFERASKTSAEKSSDERAVSCDAAAEPGAGLFCRSCGGDVSPNDRFCATCGSSIDQADETRVCGPSPNASFDFADQPGEAPSLCAAQLSDLLDAMDEPFSTTLLAIIDERGLTDAAVYRRANLSRQHFSKIRSNPRYQPTKKTVLALAVALELSLEETKDLLRRAGFALSHSSKADVIVEWFIERGTYDIFAINEALYSYDQPILG